MRRLIIAGNWKMYKTVSEAEELSNKLKLEFKDTADVEIVLCPPFTALSSVAKVINGSSLTLGAQNMYWEKEGAFTGEISPEMLKDLGVKFVIVGHSERRQFFGETNETVNKKIKAVFKYGMYPIVCVGENLKEREKNKTFDVLAQQLREGLNDLADFDLSRLIIAYEPIWAIGTGRTATPEIAQSAHEFIREKLAEMFSQKTADSIHIQYGGSVKPSNAAELLKQPDIDGALVGGASLDARDFSEIIKAGRVSLNK
ncbi:MAG: triose-phosphate isomerase [Candidatus Omnitrophota bacterium]